MAKKSNETAEEQREKVIQSLASLLRTTPFTVEFKVVKNPKGIMIIQEMTKVQMDAIVESQLKKKG